VVCTEVLHFSNGVHFMFLGSDIYKRGLYIVVCEIPSV